MSRVNKSKSEKKTKLAFMMKKCFNEFNLIKANMILESFFIISWLKQF